MFISNKNNIKLYKVHYMTTGDLMDAPIDQILDDDTHLHNGTRYSTLDYVTLVTDYLSILICILAILGNIFLVTSVCKFRVLKIRTNYYIANYAVVNTFFIITTPLFYVVMHVFFSRGIEVHWYCSVVQMQNFFVSLGIFFMFGLALDSYIDAYIYKYIIADYLKYYKFGYAILYFANFTLFFGIGSLCFTRGNNNLSNIIVTVLYFTLLIILFIVNYLSNFNKMRNIKMNNTSVIYALPSATAATLFWLPLFLYHATMLIFRNYEGVDYYLWITAFLPEFLAYSSTFILIYKLVTLNKYFKLAFFKITRIRKYSLDFERLNCDPESI